MGTETPEGLLPCAVQVGFAGSRRLYPTDCVAPTEALDHELAEQLTEHLQRLPTKLGLGPHQFLCGISQIAVGADFAFTRACGALDIPQRIFLPQPADAYLAAIGSSGSADFPPEERGVALDLLAAAQVIEHRVVTTAPTRRQRFEEVNQAIAAESDVVVCLIRAGSTARPGGTMQMLELARQRGIPVLTIDVAVQEGRLLLSTTEDGFAEFVPPRLPTPLDAMSAPELRRTEPLPRVRQFAETVKAH